MTGIITREERDELRRLYEAALPGTWVADGDGVLSRDSNGNVAVVADCQAIGPAVDDTNAALIAAARNALPRLLDTIAAFEQAARVALHKIGQHRAGQYPDGQALEAAAYALSRVLTRSR